MRRIEAIHVVISEEELDWAGKVMSLKQSGMIRVNSIGIINLHLRIYLQSKNQTIPFYKLRDPRRQFLEKSPQNLLMCAVNFDHLPMRKMKFQPLGNLPQTKEYFLLKS
uniref:Uncharacterized protein n=1 Tax=Solanum tuberosum TaxID=4113 RepID=M1DLM1_SOLTU